ncbi:Conserved virulence factor B [bioreactor metagenome]|uniref:Conserved virulence factor B n=1 Tax=bioreactor metagenome TaxID=1076179 RepID=A0A644T970_9ZZZZ|nr:S1-like domain-containing RNA-binding protein [Negativicutes bacterium]
MNKSEQLVPGSVAVLKVVRISEMGAFLDAGTGNTSDDILLHKLQQTEAVNIGDEVKVYLYRDPKGRTTASMRVPQMKEGQVARVSVINTTRDGTFVDVGAERGIFLPFSETRGKLSVGDKIWVKLYTDKSGRLAVTMEVEDELRQASKPATNVKVGDSITGTVYNFSDQGAFLFTAERFIAFMHQNEMAVRPQIGQEITARVTYVREDGRINVSTRPVKEASMDIDAESILTYLRGRGGKMPYGDTTAPEIIKEKFNISKAAFKRAIGRLMKMGLIEQREGWTYLMENNES